TSDDSIDRRLRALLYRDFFIHDYLRQTGLVNHDEILLPYANYKCRRIERDCINEENMPQKFNIERSRKTFKDMMSRYRSTSSEDGIINSKCRHSRSAQIYNDRNLISSRRNSFYHLAMNVYQACEVMMIYRNDSLSLSDNDQIVIKQKQNNDDRTIIVYKGYLKNEEISTRKTKRISSSSSSSSSSLLVEKKESSSSQQENVQERHETKKSNDSPKVENEDNIVSQFHRKLTKQTTNDNDNSGNLFQSLLSILQNGLRRMEQHEPLPPRYEGNVEDFVVIFLGIKDESNFNRSIVNFVKMFNNIEELNSFVNTLKFERIILIISLSLAESIKDLSRFDSVYILSNNITWKNDHFNIRGNFSNLESISDKIKDECLIENQFFSIQFVSTNETSKQSFCYSQLLKETLLKKDNESNLKKDFIDFSRFHYNNNHIELNLIADFLCLYLLD
ncbi:unnamed protein product, partial [Rotaria sp. Silwood2]